VGAKALTWMGFAIGLLAAGLIRQGAFLSRLLAIGASRLCDALDGAVARHTQATDLGGFLDITLDFVFYASIPLAFAVIAAKRGLHHLAVPDKSFYFVGSPTEGTETLAFFAACCLWPHYFAPLAYGFSALCGITLFSRVVWGVRAFASARSVLVWVSLVCPPIPPTPFPPRRGRKGGPKSEFGFCASAGLLLAWCLGVGQQYLGTAPSPRRLSGFGCWGLLNDSRGARPLASGLPQWCPPSKGGGGS